jgi:hypothetical protein
MAGVNSWIGSGFGASLHQKSERTKIQRDPILYPAERPHPLTDFKRPLLNPNFLSLTRDSL